MFAIRYVTLYWWNDSDRLLISTRNIHSMSIYNHQKALLHVLTEPNSLFQVKNA